MNNFTIVTDTTADLPKDYIEKHQLEMVSLTYTIEGNTYTYDNPLPEKEFYSMMRNGSLPTTSQANPDEILAHFKKIIEEKHTDILYIVFSSGLSGTFNSARIAAEELAETNPETNVVIVDSLCASMGEGLLVHKAVMMKEAGKSLEETAAWLEENKLHLVHNFTVNDLFHLYRGGRVSRTAAFLGTIASIKPILHVDNEGHLIPLANVRGRKKSIQALVDSMEKQVGSWHDKNDIIFISHGDCQEDAETLAALVKERFGYDSFLFNYVGPTIGAHSGPGTLTLFYMGDYR